MGVEPLTDEQDAFGRQLQDELDGTSREATLERDDGVSGPSMAAAVFFRPYAEWEPPERQVFESSRGRVLDVGCGAGRHSLEAQRRGSDVVAIDISPGAVAVSRARGVRDVRLLSLDAVDAHLGRFDTVLMLCGNAGLAGTREGTVAWLRRMLDGTTRDARVILDTVDPYDDDDPVEQAYLAQNAARGRMPGQVRIRIRYRERVTPWFDLLLLSAAELEGVAAESGWRVTELIRDPPDIYAVLAKRSDG
jgi:SAM-dependent methyltransferase